MLPIPSVSPKDGKSRKATYYDHIHTLFSLYQLSEAETDIMRNLALSPLAGVQNRLFANWLKLRDMNTVNALIEKGFIKAMEGRMIALHPMMQEVTMEETKPSVHDEEKGTFGRCSCTGKSGKQGKKCISLQYVP